MFPFPPFPSQILLTLPLPLVCRRPFQRTPSTQYLQHLYYRLRPRAIRHSHCDPNIHLSIRPTHRTPLLRNDRPGRRVRTLFAQLSRLPLTTNSTNIHFCYKLPRPPLSRRNPRKQKHVLGTRPRFRCCILLLNRVHS